MLGIGIGDDLGEDMENWKRAVIAGTAGTAAILVLKGRRPAAVLVGSVGLAVLASEYPERFVRIREELPSYVRTGTRFLDLAMKIGSKIEELDKVAVGWQPTDQASRKSALDHLNLAIGYSQSLMDIAKCLKESVDGRKTACDPKKLQEKPDQP